MTNLAKIKRLYLWKPSICKTFWTTLVLCIWKGIPKTFFYILYLIYYYMY